MNFFVFLISACLFCFSTSTYAESSSKTLKVIEESKPAEVKPAQNNPAEDPKYNFSNKEKQVLDDGEIGTFRYVAGGIIGTYYGFGIGHGIVGKYKESGWKFTLGETIFGTMMLIGAVNCIGDSLGRDDDDDSNCSDARFTIGFIGFAAFKIWEIYDIWTIVPAHNKEYRRLKKLERPKIGFAPIIINDRAGLAVGMTF